MIAKCAVVLFAMVGAVLADQSGYSAPASSGYAAPQYAAATGGGSGYAAAAATGYDAPAYDYSYQQDEGGFDLSKLEELLPLFLAVLGAIILAKLLAPLLMQLFVLITALLPMAINLKAPIINAILLPFGLTLCNPDGPTVFPAATGRSLGEAFGLNEDAVQIVDDLFATIQQNWNA